MWCTKNFNNDTIIYLKISPNAKKNKFLGIIEADIPHLLKIAIKSPPTEGAANKELILFLSKSFNIAKSKILIKKGLTSCKKTVVIKDTTQEDVKKTIYTLLDKNHDQSNQLLLL